MTKSQLLKSVKKDDRINVNELLGEPKASSKTLTEQKENSANESREDTLKSRLALDAGKALRSSAIGANTGLPSGAGRASAEAVSSAESKGAVKKRKLLNVSNLRSPPFLESDRPDTPVTTEPTSAQRIPLSKIPNETLASVRTASFCPVFPHETATLNDILNFIEGNTATKKDSSKKAAKKAKQKQKKEDTKKMEDLEHLRAEFYELYFKEFDAKNDLKAAKSVKKRDKKKVADFENNVKKFGKSKAKIEATILELIGGLKKNNPDFKFAYLPSKEQQVEWQGRNAASQASPQVPEAKSEPAPENRSNTQVLLSDLNAQQQSCLFTLDTSKQMVTIRRINLPHAEPQVTVTAKGPSPDKDKLLYTFINGQLISGVGGSGQQQQQPEQAQPVPAKAGEKKSKAEVRPAVAETKTAKGKKTKSASNAPAQVVEPAAGKRPKEKESSPQPCPPLEEPKAGVKKPANAPKVTSSSASAASKEADKKGKHKNKKATTDQEIESLTTATKQISLSDDKPKKEKKKVKVAKIEYVDPNYKVNKFDLLDMDEEDEYITESSSDESDEPPKPAAKTNPPKANPAPAKAAPPQSVAAPTAQKPSHAAPNTAQQNKSEKSKQSNAAKQSKATESQKKPAVVQSAPVNCQNSKDSNLKVHPKAEAIVLNTRKSSDPRPPPPPAVSDVPLTKKQKKKLAQQQAQKAAQVDDLTKSLNKKMQRLQLNPDTTIELVNEQHNSCDPSARGGSMMDQLSRGVKVEGLTLPPGITLTRVDPSTMEGARAKRESIERISHPAPQQHQQPAEFQRPPPFMPVNGPMMQQVQSSSGYIMVEPIKKQPAAAADPAPVAGAPKKKRNKKKKNKAEAESAASQNEPKIVTLRNPFFQQNDMGGGMRSQAPPNSRGQMPPNNGSQLASIIKNENGIYTIRNTAFHQALSNGINNQYRYSTDAYPQEAKQDNFSYFAANSMQSQEPAAKSTQAIGSEVKSANQSKNKPWYPIQNQAPQQPTRHSPNNNDLFGNMSHLNPQRSYSPFDATPSYGFNSDFIGASPTPHSQPLPTTSQSQFYNGNYGAFSATTATDAESLFSRPSSTCGGNRHCCDDSPPTQDASNYFDSSRGYGYKNYEDNVFLQGLHPGKRLNSEVNAFDFSTSEGDSHVELHR